MTEHVALRRLAAARANIGAAEQAILRTVNHKRGLSDEERLRRLRERDAGGGDPPPDRDDPPADDTRGDGRGDGGATRDDPPPSDGNTGGGGGRGTTERPNVERIPIPIPRKPDVVIYPDGRCRDVAAGIDMPAPAGVHPVRWAVNRMHEPGRYTSERPLVIFAAPGVYGDAGNPLFIGGGWSPGSGNTVATPDGSPLHLSIRTHPELVGRDAGLRAQFFGVQIHDRYCDVGTLRLAFVDVKNSNITAAPIMMVCGDEYSTGRVSLFGVRRLKADDGGYNGSGAKWGSHWSHGRAELLVCDATVPDTSPEEHDDYVMAGDGPVQFCDIAGNGGNRTAIHAPWYAGRPIPGGDFLIDNFACKGLGQSWGSSIRNGGSAVTLWANPRHYDHLRNVVVTESSYGGIAITCQPGFPLDERCDGLWHRKGVVIEDSYADNRTGKLKGDRAAMELNGARDAWWVGSNEVVGDLLLYSPWVASQVAGSNPVGRFHWDPGATLSVYGSITTFDPKAGKMVTLAAGSESSPIRTEEARRVLVGILDAA